MIIEGAGSPAELNLRRGDIVNMAIARHADSPVLLAGDIDKGGIFAQLLGTLWLLEPEEQALVKGFIVNKFRGDPGLFTDGVRILEERGGVPVLGVVPWLHDHGIPEEDGAGLDDPGSMPVLGTLTGDVTDIAVVKLPRIANFDDFDPLAAEPGVRVRFVQTPETLGRPAAIILPGTKHTLADLAWLRSTGLAAALIRQAESGTALVGICGGYQMLGRTISDPEGVEGGGAAGGVAGLGLLPVRVVFHGEKVTRQAEARLCGRLPWLAEGTTLTGYEIHAGRAETDAPLLHIRRLDGETADDGASTADGRVWGTHLHGLFHNDGFRRAWLASLGWQPVGAGMPYRERKAAAYDRLASALAAALDVGQLDAIIGL